MGNEETCNDDDASSKRGISRRHFIRNVSLAGAGYTVMPFVAGAAVPIQQTEDAGQMQPIAYVDIELKVNGQNRSLKLDPRITLLDVLREKLSLTGSKKGCDHGQCGACTVLLNDQRVNSCLVLAASCRNASVITIEGIAEGDKLHPIQEAFIKYDAFQCGYCTPGQICSAIGLMKEGHARTDADISELMSGNICRCGAYQHINEAIKEVYRS